VKLGLFFLLVFIFFSVVYGVAQDLEPEEPEIVLPSVILEIEDLSIERVTAALPEDEGLLAPEPQFPLPEAGELEVGEPEIDFISPQTGTPVFQVKEGKFLTAEAVLGAGTVNNFYGRVSLYFLGEKPEGKILYQHETLDGFSSEPAGSGYNIREDRLESYLNFNLGRVGFKTEGTFADSERGLQGNGNFFSKINRYVQTSLGVEIPMAGWFTLRSAVDMSAAKQLLTADVSTSEEADEYYISSYLTGECKFRRGLFGIEPGFSYRNVPDYSELTLGRAHVRGYLGIDLADDYRFDATLGWFWSEPTGHLVPFDMTVTAFLGDFFSFRIGGGYQVIEYNLKDIFTELPLAGLPATLEDNHGWFVDSGINWIPFQGWIFDAGIFFMDGNSTPTIARTIDGTTGLFPFYQEDLQTLRLEGGARWNVSESFTARAGLEYEVLEKSNFQPDLRVFLDANIVQKQGKFGGGMALNFLSGVNDTDQAPILNLNGFYKLNDHVRFVTEIDDILYPLLNGSRYYWYPYVDPGLTLKGKVHINF